LKIIINILTDTRSIRQVKIFKFGIILPLSANVYNLRLITSYLEKPCYRCFSWIISRLCSFA